ncbi:MAG: hypothetical protein NZ700_13200 [Gemmataceae bacterium]|nr:hypothetical protein [Gemmataceae bacterium]MDW8263806.1 hypothetical protein [Gemmataceae bacterium]
MFSVPVPLAQAMPTLAVAVIYCIWHRASVYLRARRERVLRERVTYMLWVMANQIEDDIEE